jgi:hypothetical protein
MEIVVAGGGLRKPPMPGCRASHSIRRAPATSASRPKFCVRPRRMSSAGAASRQRPPPLGNGLSTSSNSRRIDREKPDIAELRGRGMSMGKDDAARIADTIDFIRDATVPQQYMRHRYTVADMLRDRDIAGTISTLVSPALSQGRDFGVFHRDQRHADRQYRRSISLIRMLLQGGDPSIVPGETDQIFDDDLPSTLGTCLSQVTTTLLNNKRAIEQLKTDPLRFLTNNALNMSGMST